MLPASVSRLSGRDGHGVPAPLRPRAGDPRPARSTSGCVMGIRGRRFPDRGRPAPPFP